MDGDRRGGHDLSLRKRNYSRARCLPCIARNRKAVYLKVHQTFLGQTGASLIASEKKRFEKAIIEARGDRDKAANLLGISRATFFRRAKDLGLVQERRKSDVGKYIT